MIIVVSRVAREITLAALARHKALAQSAAATCTRLLLDESVTLPALGANEFLRAKLTEHNLPNPDLKMEVEATLEVAKHWRAALGIWAKDALKRSEQCELLTIVTDVHKQEKVAQQLLDQLQEQLGLALIDLEDLVEQGNASKAEAAPPADAEVAHDPHKEAIDADEEERAFRRDTMQPAHHGVGKAAKPPKTAGSKTLAFVHRGKGRGGKRGG